MNLVPINEQLIIEEIIEKKTPGGILLPETSSGPFTKGRVVAAAVNKPSIREGMLILFPAYEKNTITVDGKDYLVVNAERVIGFIDEGKK
jgi:co-chaperonin GroES (HSP10)